MGECLAQQRFSVKIKGWWRWTEKATAKGLELRGSRVSRWVSGIGVGGGAGG